MLTTEKAFDMLPYAVAILEKLDLQTEGRRLAEKQRAANPDQSVGVLQRDVGAALILHVVRNSGKVKDEFFALLGVATGTDAKTAKTRPLTESLQVLQEVFLDTELMGFFTAAVQ